MAEGSKPRRMLRHRIEKQLLKQQEEQRKELLKRRIEIAKTGTKLYQAGKLIEAAKSYHQYILILEMWKKCTRETLTPELFDRDKDMYEMVLLSGIYWDLAKLYDKAKNINQKEELNFYLQKYVLFSRGFPYQTLSAEAIRRYLGTGKCKHREEFKKAYSILGSEKCFIVTSLVDVTELQTLDRFRDFRDLFLLKNFLGRSFVKCYYTVGPVIAAFINCLPHFVRVKMGRALNKIARLLPL